MLKSIFAFSIMLVLPMAVMPAKAAQAKVLESGEYEISYDAEFGAWSTKKDGETLLFSPGSLQIGQVLESFKAENHYYCVLTYSPSSWRHASYKPAASFYDLLEIKGCRKRLMN